MREYFLRSRVYEYRSFNTASQKEALINEFKGNLFEYLVGSSVAQKISAHADYLRSIEPQFLARLRIYEDWLWEQASDLALQQPILAAAAADILLENVRDQFSQVRVIGKLAAGSHDDSFGEADLLLIQQQRVAVGVSLKLCGRGAYVNTKSGGIRSFLSKYFAGNMGMNLAQQRLNYVLDQSFSELAQTLHQQHSLAPSDHFGSVWREAGMTELPGELDPLDQKILQEHYFRIVSVIYEAFAHAFKNERPAFIKSLASLLGFQNSQLIQLSCFHCDKQGQRYLLDHLEVVHANKRLSELNELKLNPPGLAQASFRLEFPWGNLQIRVKPMNKFTQAAMKVNCSVRTRS